jgi:ABC-type transport system involved in multi-copper enzyme maturation permease subunit
MLKLFYSIAAFEFKYQLKSPTFVVTSLIFFLLTFGATTADGVTIGGGIGNVFINSPFAIMQTLMIMSIFGLFICTSFVANPVLRDIDTKMDGIIYSTPITKFAYLMGRFSGAFLVAVIAFSATAWGILIGSFMPWLDPEQLGDTHLWHYIYTMLFLVIPNLLFCSAFFFSLATLTRSLIATYVGVVAFMVLYFVSLEMLSEPEWEQIGALMDPFGLSAFGDMTRYWTAFERNNNLVAIEGNMLINRLIWLAISALSLVATLKWFSFDNKPGLFSRKKKTEATEERFVPKQVQLPKVETNPGQAVYSQLWTRTKFEVRGILVSLPFWVILALGIFNVLGVSLSLEGIFGTNVYPVTRTMVTMIGGAFGLIMLIILIYYGAELVWRERQVKFNEILDATPVPNWVFFASKYIAMLVVLASMIISAALTTIGVQLAKGYSFLELDLYAEGLWYYFAVPFYLFAVLSLCVQVITRNKYFGMLILVLYIISTLVLDGLGFQHNLYIFAGRPFSPYSDMNDYGHFETAVGWFDLYWAFFSLVMVVITYGLWQRGIPEALTTRLGNIQHRLGTASRVFAGVALVGFVVTGGFIYYNTNVLNEYQNRDATEKLAAEYEKTYKQYQGMPQPRITDVKADVDIYPKKRAYQVRGTYVLENQTDQALEEVMVNLNQQLKVNKLELEGASVDRTDETYGIHFFKFDPVMQPGDKRVLSFDAEMINQGFQNNGSSTSIVYNGTFFNNFESFPSLGYNAQVEITDRHDRRSHDLPPPERMPNRDDEANHQNHYIRSDSDFVTFETTVSTIEGQTAIAPGYLQKDWVENGRHYFHYKMDAPILNFFSYLSADYTVVRDNWNDVAIEIFFHKPHDFNVDRMVDAIKKSLDYFTVNFSPYQHKQMRILEFPGYASFAQSFPNTVPYSESIGFIADLRDPNAIDYVFYVTAHEVAHQWWAHQVVGANVQGATVLSETLSQYAALMVMEKEYGRDKMRRFLKYELDQYLRARGTEVLEELPLALNENQQYIHYNKGSLAMYALRDAAGEEAINRALSRYLEDWAFKGPPYSTTQHMLTYFREELGTEHEELISDLFERITIYDLKTEEAKYRQTEDGRYEVTLEISAAKFEADGQGEETERPMQVMLDVGVFSEDPDKAEGDDHVLYLQKHEITADTKTITVTVDKEPVRAGIDPYIIMIDRNPDDNIKAITTEDEAT